MKKIVSLMLVFALVCSMISMFNLVSFSAAKDDSAYDCVAYAKARFREIWGFDLHATGLNEYGVYGASGYYYNAASNGDTVSSTPQIGALAIWGGSSANQWGHVAIVENVNGSSVTYSEGGYIPYEGAPKTFNQETRNISNMSKTNQPFLGYVYIKGTGLGASVAPNVPTISIDKYVVKSNEVFNVHFYAQNAERYWIGFYLNNVLVYETATIYQELSVSLVNEGKYSVVVSAINSIGEKAGYSSIVVGDATEYLPTVPEISLSKKILDLNEILVVEFSSEKVEEYWIGFYREGVLIFSCTPTSNEYLISFDKLGKYSVVVSSINKFGEVSGNLKFTVGKYDVVFDSNDGTNSELKQIKAYNTDLVLTSTIPVREGYTFLGWSTNKNATVAEYSAGSIYSKNEDVTLYAVWQKNPVTVSSISIATTPSKTEYYVGDTFASSGLTVKATMSDGTTQTLTSGFTVSSPNMSTAGTKTVTVTYSGKTAIFTINVKEKPVTPDIPDTNFTISIKEPSRTTIRYNDGIILHANVEGELPENSNVVWYVSNDNFDAGYLDDGMSCVFVSKNNGYTTIYAVLEDANGNELAVDSIEMRSKAGFFDKIGGFFRSLFGSTKIYEN